MTDRSTKERKLMALVIADLDLDPEQPEMAEVGEEVRALPDEELDRTLANRLDLPYPAEEQAMEQALSRIEEPELALGGETGSVLGTTDTGHEPRPEVQEG